MKFKVCLILTAIFTFISYDAHAYVYSLEKTPSGKIVRPMPKQSSSIVRSSVNMDEDIADYSKVITELQEQINLNPDDYSLLVPLVDAYLKTKKYENAYEDLEYLNSLKNSGKLSEEVLQDIEKLRVKTMDRGKYSRDKSSLFLNVAVINLICDNFAEAEKNIRKASLNTVNHKMYVDALKLVIDSSADYENGLLFSNIYLTNNKIPEDIKKEIAKLRVYFFTNQGKYEDALNEQIEILQTADRDSGVLYETYKLLVRNNASDDKILRTLFGENCKNKEQCYYDLYNLLFENNNYDDAKAYGEKLEKQYPSSLSTAFLKAERLLKEGQINQVIEILNSVSDKLSRNEDIATYNRLMASISRTPDKEALKLFNQGYPEKALELLDAKNIAQTPNILAFKARCCMVLNRMQEALDYLNRAISLDSDNLFVNIQFGNYYYVTKDYETARQYAEKCLQIEPDNEFAMQLLDKLNELDASDYISQIIDTYEAQNYEETERLIDEALKIAPNSAVLYYYQGLTYIAKNNYAASTASLYKSLELDSSNIFTYYYLGITFDNLSEYENAYNCYVQFLKLLPPDELGESDKIQHAKSRINKLQKLL